MRPEPPSRSSEPLDAQGERPLDRTGARTVTVLVIDDEPQIRRALRHLLADVGVRVIEAANGRAGLDLAAMTRPDLVVLDIGLPDIPGEAVCRELRAWFTAPILVLSARHAEPEKVRLLDAGADDYMTKPFGPDEFAARVRAHLRRTQLPASPTVTEPVRAGEVEIDLYRRRVTRAGLPVHLTKIEWELLRTFLSQAGRTLTHRQLFDTVWGRAYGNAAQYLRVHITNLRRKIEPDPAAPTLIITEPGVGYRLELPRGSPPTAEPG